jgi:hypothetical protein
VRKKNYSTEIDSWESKKLISERQGPENMPVVNAKPMKYVPDIFQNQIR